MKRSRPLLFVVPSLQEAWEDVIAPWFDQVLPGAWQSELPSLVVIPTRGQANDIKARLIAKGSSHLGRRGVCVRCWRGMMRLRRVSLNFCVCFSLSQPVKWKIGLTNLKRLLLKLLLARPRHYCARWIASKLPVGNSKNSGCRRLRQWFSVLMSC